MTLLGDSKFSFISIENWGRCRLVRMSLVLQLLRKVKACKAEVIAGLLPAHHGGFGHQYLGVSHFIVCVRDSLISCRVFENFMKQKKGFVKTR